jgi:hypothetical protein
MGEVPIVWVDLESLMVEADSVHWASQRVSDRLACLLVHGGSSCCIVVQLTSEGPAPRLFGLCGFENSSLCVLF